MNQHGPEDYAYAHPGDSIPTLTSGNCHRDRPYWARDHKGRMGPNPELRPGASKSSSWHTGSER